jgi:hypothetical protein
MKFKFKKFFSLKEPKNGLLFIFILALVLAASVFFISKNNTNANYDYICTQTVPISGACVIPADGWTEWEVVTYPTASTTGQTKRTGTGSKEISLVKSYVASTRGACGAGSVQVARGTAVNSSTWWGGETNIVSAVCQVDQFNIIPMLPLPLPVVCVAPQVRLLDGTCGDSQPIDLCSNISGIQTVLGGLSIDTHTGSCGFEGGDSDMCLNVPGFQSKIPSNMMGSSTMGVRQCAGIDAYKITNFLNIVSTCTAKQGTSSVIYLNKDMEWEVNIPANITSGLTINDTIWEGTDLPVTGKVVNGTNILHKIYTTVGLKTITGSVSAHNADGSIVYTITCQNNGADKSPLNVSFGGGSTVEE